MRPQAWSEYPLKHVAKDLREPGREGLDYLGLEHVEPRTGKAIGAALNEEVAGDGIRAVPGDVLFGKLRPYLAKVLRVDRELTCTSEFAVLRPGSLLEQDFLYYRALAHDFIESMTQATEGAKMPRVSPEDIRNFRVALPPLPTQRAVASYLDRETAKIDRLIEKKERLLQLLDEQRTSLISEVVTKGLDPEVPMKDSGAEWIGAIPAGWEVTRAKHLLSSITSGSRGWAKYFSEEGPLFLQSRNLDGAGGLDVADVERVQPPAGAEGRRTLVAPDDILMCITGALTGNVSLVPQDLEEAYVNQHLALLRVQREAANPEYLSLVLRSLSTQRQLTILQYGGTKQGLGLDDIRNLLVPLPSRSEQDEIVAWSREFLAACAGLQHRVLRAIRLLHEYRASLISEVVTGSIEVPAEVPA